MRFSWFYFASLCSYFAFAALSFGGLKLRVKTPKITGGTRISKLIGDR